MNMEEVKKRLTRACSDYCERVARFDGQDGTLDDRGCYSLSNRIESLACLLDGDVVFFDRTLSIIDYKGELL